MAYTADVEPGDCFRRASLYLIFLSLYRCIMDHARMLFMLISCHASLMLKLAVGANN